MNNFEVEGTLERMKMIKRGAPLSTLWPSDIDIIINALEKQIPKKPLNRKEGVDGYYGYCPSCNHDIDDYYNDKYCGECGQAINWEVLR